MAENRENNYRELGTTGLRRFGGSVVEERLKELQGTKGRIKYREMRDNDPVIAAMFFALTHTLKQASWRIQPADETEADQLAAEFVESCFEDMSFSWVDTLGLIIDPMLEQGFALVELIYKKRLGDNPPAYIENPAQSRYNDNRIGWRKWASRPAESLYPGNEWIFDDSGGIKGINQYDAYGTGRAYTVPMEKMLHFRTSVHPANTPEPMPIHRAAYLPYYYTQNIQEIEGIGVERDLAGLPVVYLGDDCTTSGASSDYELAKDLVANIRQDEQAGVVIPKARMGGGAGEGKGMLLELLSTGGGRSHDTGAIIDRYDKRKAMTILAQFVMVGMGETGSYALDKNKTDLFLMAAESWIKNVAGIVNRFAIPRLLALNSFPGITGMPKMITSPLGMPDLMVMADYVNKLVDKAIITPDAELERYLRQLGNLPMPPKNTSIPTAPAQPVKKAEMPGDLTPEGREAYDVTNELERQIRLEWQKLQSNIATGMSIKKALEIYRQRAENYIRQGLTDAWLAGRGGAELTEVDNRKIEAAIAIQADYLRNFMIELETDLQQAEDDNYGGILLTNLSRAVMYAGAAWAVYNTARVFGQRKTSRWQWVGPVDSSTCPDCAAEVAAGIRPLSEIKRLPGSVQCLGNCRHELQRVN